jgi:cyclopropane-fatty-acyl-phospholipid synthase
LMDYRNVTGTFDRIISVGMFEHVGPPHYKTFFKQCCERLSPEGVMLLRTIGRADGPEATDPWLAKYIFPGGYVPALSQMMPAIERSYLWLNDLEVLRLHYAYTLERWYDPVRDQSALRRTLFRMWQFYLAGAISAFRNDGHVVFQLQLTRKRDAVPIVRDYIGVSESRLRQDAEVPDAR